jgi:hypothetical protein
LGDDWGLPGQDADKPRQRAGAGEDKFCRSFAWSPNQDSTVRTENKSCGFFALFFLKKNLGSELPDAQVRFIWLKIWIRVWFNVPDVASQK